MIRQGGFLNMDCNKGLNGKLLIKQIEKTKKLQNEKIIYSYKSHFSKLSI